MTDCQRWPPISSITGWPQSSRRAGRPQRSRPRRRLLPFQSYLQRSLNQSNWVLVASFNRPGGNVTGMSVFSSEMWAKSVELLKELVPTATRMAYLVNPSSPSAEFYSKGAAAAASALGIEVHVLNASTEHGLDEAFAALVKLGTGGLVVPNEPFFDVQRERIVALAARYAIPAIYGTRENAVAGGLLSYGASIPDSYRQAGIYVGRILKGEKPADLPVALPTKFELVINLQTAKGLGIEIPPMLLARADEVIE
jgi:putative ABC transport system substrate-binding protein